MELFTQANSLLKAFEALPVIIIILILFFSIFVFVFIILGLIGRIMFFKKAGQPGWKAIIPFYSQYVLDVDICQLHWAFFLLEIVLTAGGVSALLTLVIRAMRFYNISLKCHKDPALLTIFGTIFGDLVLIICGFAYKIKYDKKVKVSNCSFFDKLFN